MNFGYLYTSFEGRINRAKYWAATIILIIIVLVIMFGVGFALGMSMNPEDHTFKLIVLVCQLIFLYPSAAVMVKRLHDRNRPGWFAVFMLGPVAIKAATDAFGITGDMEHLNGIDHLLNFLTLGVGIWFFIELGCLRGTIGDNQYGPDPLAIKVEQVPLR
jgi:uncharacterized membrane protein YhaH (DUF805 family)